MTTVLVFGGFFVYTMVLYAQVKRCERLERRLESEEAHYTRLSTQYEKLLDIQRN